MTHVFRERSIYLRSTRRRDYGDLLCLGFQRGVGARGQRLGTGGHVVRTGTGRANRSRRPFTLPTLHVDAD